MTSHNVNEQPIPFATSSSGKDDDPFGFVSNPSARPTGPSAQPPIQGNGQDHFTSQSTDASFFASSVPASQPVLPPATSAQYSYSSDTQEVAYAPTSYQSYTSEQQPREGSYQAQDSQTQQNNAYQTQDVQPSWVAFDPNVHYYYDDQGQYHYYDPNTGQVLDYAQYNQLVYGYNPDEYPQQQQQPSYTTQETYGGVDDTNVTPATDIPPQSDQAPPDAPSYVPPASEQVATAPMITEPQQELTTDPALVNPIAPPVLETLPELDVYSPQRSFATQPSATAATSPPHHAAPAPAPITSPLTNTTNQWDHVDVNGQQQQQSQPPMTSVPVLATVTATTSTYVPTKPMDDLADDLDELILSTKKDTEHQPSATPSNALYQPTPPTSSASVAYPAGPISRQMSPAAPLSRSGVPFQSAASLPPAATIVTCKQLACQAINKNSSKFCEDCGAPLSANVSRTATPVNQPLPPAQPMPSIPAAPPMAPGPVIPAIQSPPPLPLPQTSSQEQQPYNRMYTPPPPTTLQQQPVDYNPYQPASSAAPAQQTTYAYDPNMYNGASYMSMAPQTTQQPAQPFVSAMQPSSVYDPQHYQQPQMQPPSTAGTPSFYAAADPYIQPPQQQRPADDPLQRNRGCPVVRFGFGGRMVVMFPKTIQQYSIDGASSKCVAGSVQIKSFKDVCQPADEQTDTLGPLLADPDMNAKNKKKALLAFLDQHMSSLVDVQSDAGLLWQLVKIMIDLDGNLPGSEKTPPAVLDLLAPLNATNSVDENGSNFTVPAMNYYQSTSSPPTLQRNLSSSFTPDNDSTAVLDKLQLYLSRGHRTEAVNYAMEQDLWPHALIISSCVDQALWQKVTRGFAQRDLAMTASMQQTRQFHPVAADRAGLRVLYGLFSGLGAAAVNDFLKPETPSLQTTNLHQPHGPSLDELSKWKETLELILANRTARDLEAMTALGDTMNRHGWSDAAHICYLLSPGPSVLSGLDTPQVRMTLIGCHNMYLDRKDSLLTEMVEFALSLRTGQSGQCLPHLQGYKLMRALELANLGYLKEAVHYCQAIQQCIKNFQHDSPYLHAQLMIKVKELQERCLEAESKKNAG
ncbi:hypothetical protein DM01DRAFT_77955 [Hesseltinella vesiculosa]|uniref:Protein transport protein sec16 n=1 Tax=Hesseltinella vesiculosa TaxID=101127 RepID=A0A1X2G428_9FUNG|nr:hypothetical protein DM01DRAFT_77955 [Hesseltinella vesiculosa]